MGGGVSLGTVIERRGGGDEELLRRVIGGGNTSEVGNGGFAPAYGCAEWFGMVESSEDGAGGGGAEECVGHLQFRWGVFVWSFENSLVLN